MKRKTVCKVVDCDSGDRIEGYGYCLRHYRRLKKYNNPEQIVGTDKRGSIVKNNIVYLPLGIKAKDGYAIVDLKNKYLDKYNWHLTTTGYPASTINRKNTKLYNMIIGQPENGRCIDHINRNKLDNRENNLRIVDYTINAHNATPYGKSKSGVFGVHFYYNRWQVNIGINHRNIYLGRYKKLEDAIAARKEAEMQYWVKSNG